jgi:hypothetical protein
VMSDEITYISYLIGRGLYTYAMLVWGFQWIPRRAKLRYGVKFIVGLSFFVENVVKGREAE